MLQLLVQTLCGLMIQPARTDSFGTPLPPGKIANFGGPFFRHPAPIRAVQFSRAGRLLITMDGVGTVRSWSYPEGLLLHSLPPRGRQLLCGMSSNDRLLIIATPDGSVFGWDPQTGNRFDLKLSIRSRNKARDPRFPVVDEDISDPRGTVRLSADGSLLALVVGSGFTLIDLRSRRVASLPLPPGVVPSFRQIAFSGDNRHLFALAGDQEQGLIVWSVPECKLVGHGGLQTSEAFDVYPSPDGSSFLLALTNGVVAHLSLQVQLGSSPTLPGRLRFRRLSVVTQEVTLTYGFLPTERPNIVILPLSEEQLAEWDFSLQRIALVLPIPSLSGIFSASVSQDGRTIVLARDMDTVPSVIDRANGFHRSLGRGHSSRISTLAFAPDGKTLYSGSNDGSVRVWNLTPKLFPVVPDLRSNRPGFELRYPQTSRVFSIIDRVALSAILVPASQEYFISATYTGCIQRVPLHRGGRAWHLYTADTLVKPILSPDGKYVVYASGADTNGVQVRSIETGEPDGPQDLGDETPFAGITFTKDGKYLLARTFDNRFFAWETKTYEAVEAFGETGVFGFLSTNGTRLWLNQAIEPNSGNRFLEVIDLRSGKTCFTRNDAIGLFALSVDGRHLIEAQEGIIRFIDLYSGKPVRSWQAETGQISAFAVSPDGRFLAVGTESGRIGLWELRASASPEFARYSLEEVWEQLGSDDPSLAFAFEVALAERGDAATTFLRSKLRPIPIRTQEEIQAIFDRMEDNRFAIREKAGRDLARLGESADELCRAALRRGLPAETRDRVNTFLRRSYFPPSGDRLRALNAIAVLGRIGSPAARELLSRLAAGGNDEQTDAAWRALELRNDDQRKAR